MHLQGHNISWYVHVDGNNIHYFICDIFYYAQFFIAFMNLFWSFGAVLRYCSYKQSLFICKVKDYSWMKIVEHSCGVNSWFMAIRADKISESVMCKQVLEREWAWRPAASHARFYAFTWGTGRSSTLKPRHSKGSSAVRVLPPLQGAVCDWVHRNACELVLSCRLWGMTLIIYESTAFSKEKGTKSVCLL